MITWSVFRAFDLNCVGGGWYKHEEREFRGDGDGANDGPGSRVQTGAKQSLGSVVRIDEGRIGAHLDELVRP